jgi:hypothetical protein
MRRKDSLGDKLRYNLGRRKAKMEIPLQVVPFVVDFARMLRLSWERCTWIIVFLTNSTQPARTKASKAPPISRMRCYFETFVCLILRANVAGGAS